MSDNYRELGFEDRHEYLADLAAENGLPLDYVLTLADLLGENEDFDGLVTSLEDFSHGF